MNLFGCLQQVLFRAPELSCKHDSLGSTFVHASLYSGQNCKVCSGVCGSVSLRAVDLSHYGQSTCLILGCRSVSLWAINLSHSRLSTCLAMGSQPVSIWAVNLSHSRLSICLTLGSWPVSLWAVNLSLWAVKLSPVSLKAVDCLTMGSRLSHYGQSTCLTMGNRVCVTDKGHTCRQWVCSPCLDGRSEDAWLSANGAAGVAWLGSSDRQLC